MKTILERAKEYIFEQKCIPWTVHVFVKKLWVFFFGEYDKDFFDSKHRKEVRDTCVFPVVSTLIKKYKPKSVIDLGCGDGIYLEEFKSNGVDVFGLEYSKEGVKRCIKKHINIKRFNILKDDFSFTRKFDLAICFEVAEHLPASASDRLVDLVSKLGKVVVFTAAPPGQGGTGHVNEQPKSYWEKKFIERGCTIDVSNTGEFQKLWIEAGVVKYMASNLLVFKTS